MIYQRRKKNDDEKWSGEEYESTKEIKQERLTLEEHSREAWRECHNDYFLR